MDAGDEIFLNYGHCHDDIKSMPSWAAHIPKKYDIEVASKVMKRLYRYIKQQHNTIGKCLILVDIAFCVFLDSMQQIVPDQFERVWICE